MQTQVQKTYRGGVLLSLLKQTTLPLGITPFRDDFELPREFDARAEWAECPSLHEVRDQGCCASSWAVAAASVMTDRWCIHSEAHEQFHFGSTDLLACCSDCGHGCNGGALAPAWYFWVENGVSSGGLFQSDTGCRPYPFDVCTDEYQELYETPKCTPKCNEKHNATLVSEDRRYGRVAYRVPSDMERIMEEIYLHGPVEAAMRMYSDFEEYTGGVYRHSQGEFRTGHAVKLLGWGEENGQKYWLAANSWGEVFGEGGFFKIVRGENHVGIEDDVYAALPNYKKRATSRSYRD